MHTTHTRVVWILPKWGICWQEPHSQVEKGKLVHCVSDTRLLIDHHFSPIVWVWKPVLSALHSTTGHQLRYNLCLSSPQKQTWECKFYLKQLASIPGPNRRREWARLSSKLLSHNDHLLDFVNRARLWSVSIVDVEVALDERTNILPLPLILVLVTIQVIFSSLSCMFLWSFYFIIIVYTCSLLSYNISRLIVDRISYNIVFLLSWKKK